MNIFQILVFIAALCVGHHVWAAESDCPWDQNDPRYALDQRCKTGSGGYSGSLDDLSVEELSQQLQELTGRLKAGDSSAAPQAVQVQQALQRKIIRQYQTPNPAGVAPASNLTGNAGAAPDACQDPRQKSSNYSGCCFPNKKFSSADLNKGVECTLDGAHSKTTQYYKMAGDRCFFRQDRAETISIQKFNVATTYLEEYQWQGLSCGTSFSENNSRSGLDIVSQSAAGVQCRVTQLSISFFEEKTGDCNCEKDTMNYREFSKDTNPVSSNFKTLNYDRCDCQQCSPVH